MNYYDADVTTNQWWMRKSLASTHHTYGAANIYVVDRNFMTTTTTTTTNSFSVERKFWLQSYGDRVRAPRRPIGETTRNAGWRPNDQFQSAAIAWESIFVMNCGAAASRRHQANIASSGLQVPTGKESTAMLVSLVHELKHEKCHSSVKGELSIFVWLCIIRLLQHHVRKN